MHQEVRAHFFQLEKVEVTKQGRDPYEPKGWAKRDGARTGVCSPPSIGSDLLKGKQSRLWNFLDSLVGSALSQLHQAVLLSTSLESQE